MCFCGGNSSRLNMFPRGTEWESNDQFCGVGNSYGWTLNGFRHLVKDNINIILFRAWYCLGCLVSRQCRAKATLSEFCLAKILPNKEPVQIDLGSQVFCKFLLGLGKIQPQQEVRTWLTLMGKVVVWLYVMLHNMFVFNFHSKIVTEMNSRGFKMNLLCYIRTIPRFYGPYR